MPSPRLIRDALEVEDKGGKDFAVVLLPLPDALECFGCSASGPIDSWRLYFLLYLLCLFIFGCEQSTLKGSGLHVAWSLAEHTGFGLLEGRLLGRGAWRQTGMANARSLHRRLLIIGKILLVKVLS